MARRTLFRIAHPCCLRALLDLLVVRTNERLGPNRPQVTTLKPAVAEINELPAFIKVRANDKVGLLYSQEPSPTLPLGEPVLFISFRPVPERGWQRDGLFSGEIVVDVWRDDYYPLTQEEVEWLAADHCGCEGHYWLQVTTTCWRELQLVCEDDLVGIDLAAIASGDRSHAAPRTAPGTVTGTVTIPSDGNVPSDDEQAESYRPGRWYTARQDRQCKRKRNGSHRGSGEPRKPYTFWLMEHMRPLENLYDFQHLFPGYLHVYEETQGDPPANPRTSFIQAAEACVERILRERKKR